MTHSFKLGIDWGEKSLGVALSRLDDGKNEVIYASTLVAEVTWLKEKVSGRTEERRLKRTRKSKRKRLKLIKNALKPLVLDNQLESFVLSFCKRRGFDYADEEEAEDKEKKKNSTEEKRYSRPRSYVIDVLSKELENRCPARAKEILSVLEALLHRQMRPKRFWNRNTSKCQWQDCTKNTPKKGNSVEETLVLELYPKLSPFLVKEGSSVENSAEVKAKIEVFIKEATGLSARHRRDKNETQDEAKKEFKKLRDEFKKDILGLIKDKERFNKVWKKRKKGEEGGMAENLNRIVLGSPGGRQTFCRKHVKEYKEFFLAGKEIPKRDEITEADLTKRQEILFSKLFAFVKGRLLPLTRGQGIQEISVERNAFDVVPRK
ncbi:MAG TPA: hypothetical protein ACFYD3_11715, partial [Candidatus Hypogeohydataceae bacterium YC41]